MANDIHPSVIREGEKRGDRQTRLQQALYGNARIKMMWFSLCNFPDFHLRRKFYPTKLKMWRGGGSTHISNVGDLDSYDLYKSKNVHNTHVALHPISPPWKYVFPLSHKTSKYSCLMKVRLSCKRVSTCTSVT